MKYRFLTQTEVKNIEKAVAKYEQPLKDLKSKLPSNTEAAEAELTKAGMYIINDYIVDNPGVLDLGSKIFSPGTVNANNKLEVELGYSGTAYMHAPGTAAELAVSFTDTLTAKLYRFSWMYKIDINAVRNQNIVKLLEDAANIRDKIALRKFKYIWETIRNSFAATDPIYVSAASVTKTNLDSVLKKMEDVAGSATAIIGRQSLISDIYDFAGYSDFTLRDVEQGILRQYRGATLIGIQDRETKIIDGAGNEFPTAQIPADALLIVGDKAGYDGGIGVKTVSNFDVPLAADIAHTFEDYCCAIVDKRKIGLYKIA